ncbi:MAG: hypothetical protein VX942_01050, partial [Candidatus Thermoplasmatota archaeon]|nr:hypothetical protein [Candidatus Thermoplasmatota archaeon]
MMISVSATGCIYTNDTDGSDNAEEKTTTRIFVTGPDGRSLDIPPIAADFVFSDVGEDGAEPSIGITSSG